MWWHLFKTLDQSISDSKKGVSLLLHMYKQFGCKVKYSRQSFKHDMNNNAELEDSEDIRQVEAAAWHLCFFECTCKLKDLWIAFISIQSSYKNHKIEKVWC